MIAHRQDLDLALSVALGSLGIVLLLNLSLFGSVLLLLALHVYYQRVKG